jgi:hypothetical protein
VGLQGTWERDIFSMPRKAWMEQKSLALGPILNLELGPSLTFFVAPFELVLAPRKA